MRILIVTWSSRHAGGVETYLARVMPALRERGHDIGFCYETDEPSDRPPISLPADVAAFPIGRDEEGALAAIRDWHPEVTFVHGLLEPEREARVLDLAPAVFFAHSYYGTCISGDKTHKFPVVEPCGRRFGAACLALYFPRRCGGLSPLEMARAYSRQRHRLQLLHRYAAVLTNSDHMRRELTRHGAAGGRVHDLSHAATDATEAPAAPLGFSPSVRQSGPWRLMFVGRMDRLKGGGTLIEALPRVAAATVRAVHVTFAGDGPARRRWEREAGRAMRTSPRLTVDFVGWVQQEALGERLDSTDVMVVPSLWPEPFGLVGPEANRRGVPVVAFATGGIPEWLHEGINGCLAPADPPTAAGLAEALTRCLRSLESSDQLRGGALRMGVARLDDLHIDALVDVLREAATGVNGTRA
jgi:glycosyltransferase involved in cell wall biosynthesis